MGMPDFALGTILNWRHAGRAPTLMVMAGKDLKFWILLVIMRLDVLLLQAPSFMPIMRLLTF